ncbi:hypothetical protein BCR35DRAFT_334408 [Leucosporidium creatinivorum]|uniref:Uncharacterized protein n=1 Tax=Leucosporidium creatinivorum TaxID=106004 RepID=A0A1Y2E9R1_9BASI|nr:hypothetical protein BCR35DRAFT_334408 [Leucosporidium creatinivorum]
MAAPAPTPCDLAWSHIQIDPVIPPLQADASAEQWAAAFNTRDNLCTLLLGALPPLMKYIGTPPSHAEMIAVADRALEQATQQRSRLNSEGKPAGLNVNLMLKSYITTICSKMVTSARNPGGADVTVYLCTRNWDELDFLRRAHGVLAARAYFEHIQFHASLRGHPSAPPLLLKAFHNAPDSMRPRLVPPNPRQSSSSSTQSQLTRARGSSPFHFANAGTAYEVNEEREEREGLARRTIEQNEEQMDRLGATGVPHGTGQAGSMLNTFVGGPSARRPFTILMHKEYTDQALRIYVQQIASKMRLAARRPEQASLTLYLIAKFWSECSLLQKAEGVVSAKRYREMIERAAHQLNSEPREEHMLDTKVMATPCEAAWEHLDLDLSFPRLTSEASAAQWREAMDARTRLLALFELPSPYFQLPDAPGARSVLEQAIRQSVDQRSDARWNGHGLPLGGNQRNAFASSLTGTAHARRPFCEFLDIKLVDQLLRRFVEDVSARMARSAQRVEQANLLVWLAARHWSRLDPLRRAIGVLAAKTYQEYIQLAAQRQHELRMAAQFTGVPNTQQHLPSLTKRQARRSDVSQAQLQARWAA